MGSAAPSLVATLGVYASSQTSGAASVAVGRLRLDLESGHDLSELVGFASRGPFVIGPLGTMGQHSPLIMLLFFRAQNLKIDPLLARDPVHILAQVAIITDPLIALGPHYDGAEEERRPSL